MWVERCNSNGREKWDAAVPTVATFAWQNRLKVAQTFILLDMGKTERYVVLNFVGKRKTIHSGVHVSHRHLHKFRNGLCQWWHNWILGSRFKHGTVRS